MATKLLLAFALLIQAQEIFTLTFKDSPANDTVLSTLAADTTLHCSATAPSPPFLISWKHNGAYINASSRTYARYNQTTGLSAYTISRGVTYSDSGAYQCVALNAQGNVLALSAIGTLTVVGPPLLLPPVLSALVVPLGGYAIFTTPSVISNPPYSGIVWYNGTAALQNGVRVAITSSALIISNVQATDAGNYECVVTNSYGTTNMYVTLSIGSPAAAQLQILVGLNRSNVSYYSLIQGDQLILLCTYAQGSNIYGLAWTKDLVPLTSHLTVGSSGVTFSLGSINRSDAGLYVCAAQNQQGGVVQAGVMVDVQYPPYFTVVPASRTVNYSTILQNMQCQASSNPGPPTITWSAPNGQSLQVSNGAPVLGPLWGRDSGTYTCTAANSIGVNTAGVTITVLDVPQVIVSPSYLAVLQGMPVFLDCVASGSPPVTKVTWLKTSGTAILGNSSELFLSSVTTDESGQYSCTATNSYGSQTAYMTLTVLVPPIITVLPVITAITVGQSFTLLCTPSFPIPGSTITWFLNNIPITTLDPTALVSNYNLTTPSAQMVNNGVYTCRVSIGQLSFVGSGQVITGVAPTALTPPTTVRVQPGSSAVLLCNTTGFPTPSTQWSKLTELGQSQDLPLVGATFRVVSEGLLFTSVVREDSGWYTGWIENIFGTAQCYARLQVAGAPLVLSITPTTLIATYTFSLTCAVAYNYPQVAVQWSRTDNGVIPTDRSVLNGTSLTISPVKPGDEGSYQCHVSNAFGSSSLNQFITVLVPPTVTVPASPAIIILDKDAQLLCTAAGKPLPSVQWSSEDESSFSSDHIAVSGTSPNLTLFIYNVTYSDEGTAYVCNASNEVSYAVGQVIVTVRGAPPTYIAANATTSRAVVILWGRPIYSRNLMSYQVSYKALSSTMQSVIYNVSSNISHAYILGLHPAMTYTISVQGMYSNGVQGLSAMLLVTTLEEAPSSPPQLTTVISEVDALSISWQPPPLLGQNGIIVQYNIYYRLTPTATASSAAHFSRFIYIPGEPNATTYTYILAGLAGGSSYDIMLSAATSIGSGPNSTIATFVTMKGLPVVLILATTIPGGSVLIFLLLTVVIAICCLCCRRLRSSKRHSTLEEEEDGRLEAGDMWSRRKPKKISDIAEGDEGVKAKDFKSRRKKGRLVISGPVPGAPMRTEVIGVNKLTVMDKTGTVLSWHPRMITAEDMAPPPHPGGTVQMVSQKSLPSTYHESKGEDSYSSDSFDTSPPSTPQKMPQSRSSGIYAEPDLGGVTIKPLKSQRLNAAVNPMRQEADSRSSPESDGLKATKNSVNLLSNDKTDSTNQLYASVPTEHIAMKRLRRENQHQDQEQHQEHSGWRHHNDDPVQEDDVTYREDVESEMEGEYTFTQGLEGGQEGLGEWHQMDKKVLFGGVGQTKVQKKVLQKEMGKGLEEQRREETKRRKERQKILAEARNLSEKERRRQDKEKHAMKMARDLDSVPTPRFDVNARSRALFNNAAASIF